MAWPDWLTEMLLLRRSSPLSLARDGAFVLPARPCITLIEPCFHLLRV